MIRMPRLGWQAACALNSAIGGSICVGAGGRIMALSTRSRPAGGRHETLSCLAITIAVASLGAACATDASLRDAERLALYQAHAGAPVRSFQYFGSLNGWTPLGEEAVALWTRPNEAYLLSFNGTLPGPGFRVRDQRDQPVRAPCTRSSTRWSCSAAARSTIPCYIREIRPLDVKAIKQAEREMRANARVMERT